MEEKKIEAKKILNSVKNQRLAGYLMMLGFPLISMRPLKEDPMKNIFFFYKNDEVDNAINEYYRNKD